MRSPSSLLRAALPFLIALLAYSAAWHVIAPANVGDEPHYALEARSIAVDHDVDLANDYASPSRVRFVFAYGSLVSHAARYKTGGEYVSYHGVGLPILLTPAAALHSIWLMRLTMVLIAALAAQLLFQLLARFARHRPVLLWSVWFVTAFSLPMLTYANQLYPEIPAAVCILAVALVLATPRAPRWAYVLGGACAAALPWLHVRFTVVSLGLTALLALRALLGARGRPRADAVLGVLAVALPVAAGYGLLAVAFQHWYGSPLPSAPLHASDYTVAQSSDRPAAFSVANSINWSRTYRGLFGTVMSSRQGWLPFAPVAALGISGLVMLILRRSWWALAGALLTLVYLLQIATSGVLPGYSFPARFDLAFLALAAIPLLIAVRDVGWLRWPFVALGLASLAISAMGVLRSGLLYPGALGDVRPPLRVVGPLLRPWPAFYVPTTLVPFSLSRTQSESLHQVGRLQRGPGGAVTAVAPAGAGPGLLTYGRPSHIPGGEYTLAFTIGGDLVTPPRPVIDVALRTADDPPGAPIIHQAIPSSSLIPGQLRSFTYEFSVPGPTTVEPRIRALGVTTVRAGDVQVISTTNALNGLGIDPDAHPDVAGAIIWSLVIAGTGVAAFATTRRRRRLGLA